MKKAVLIPDSFKGTLSSIQICDIMENKIKQYYPDCNVVSIPVADGGEGSVQCFLSALGGQRIFVDVMNPYMEKMNAYYGILKDNKTAVIEMAACAGLPLVEGRKNPSLTTTYGVGEMMVHAAKKGVKRIIVGLGGSCTNDGGCGAAAAAGVAFKDCDGNSFIPVGGSLNKIAHIDMSNVNKVLNDVEVITMCDIDNTMYGPEGAAHVFGPQKGADSEMVLSLDEGIKHLAHIIKKDLHKDLAHVKGTGAAGAMGAGMIAFFDSMLQMGIETVLDTVKFDDVIKGANLIITGEGKIDSQSLRGKVVAGVAKRAKKQNIHVIAIVGGADEGIDEIYDMGVTSVFTTNRLPVDLEISKQYSAENLIFTMDNIFRLLKNIKSGGIL